MTHPALMGKGLRLSLTTLIVLAGRFVLPADAPAQQGFTDLCPLFIQQQQLDLEDLELEVQQDQTRFDVADEIFDLLDGLYQNDLFERLPYLAVKNSRDVAEIDLLRTQSRSARQRAVLDQFRLACSAAAEPQRASEEDDAVDEAYERYLTAECRLRELDVMAYEVDIDYRRVLLESVLDMRQSDIGTRQEVLRAERDLELTRQQLVLARERAARCRQ